MQAQPAAEPAAAHPSKKQKQEKPLVLGAARSSSGGSMRVQQQPTADGPKPSVAAKPKEVSKHPPASTSDSGALTVKAGALRVSCLAARGARATAPRLPLTHTQISRQQHRQRQRQVPELQWLPHRPPHSLHRQPQNRRGAGLHQR